ncbi:MAG TPA: CotH kinase family protein [Candidatus Corynebacterium avicola]|uniref:CotH kinase family protein n=1 Tax=Candidatus Corynebacterium avicola TaxID=2838527 RepID=A0A9D1RLN9_9CORY|nr:CotH kinase family protein [Candidatus Corynebacterium avicola]
MTAPNSRTPLRHRLPVRLRHHWKLLAVIVAVALTTALVFGASMVRPYITSDLVSETVITNNIEGDTDLFDESEHTIDISFNQDEYEEMIKTYQDDGEKEFIRADITIDGTLIENVGLRLKGNSTLMSLRSDGQGPGGGEGGGPGVPGGAEGAEGAEGENTAADDAAATEDADATADDAASEEDAATAGDTEADDAAAGGPGGGGGGGMTQLDESAPEELPWLISFDEYEEGRSFEGRTEIALRPAASGSDVALNEALALSLTEESGQETQQFSFSTVTVNGEESASRLVLDSPDALWADDLGDGVLYKGRASGSLDYLGDDPTDYEEAFKQINGEGAYDLQPVMTFLDFVNNSSDEEFAEQLEDYLDTESFAKYLATQELISNNDAMDGPGNNYYLWYDTEEEQFTVLSWDLNMALSGMGGGMGPGMGDTTEGETTEGQTTEGEAADGTMPEGAMPQGEMPEGAMPQGEMPEGEMPEGEMSQGEMPEGGPGGDSDEEGGPGGGGGSRGSGVLKERFLDNEEFYAMYEEAYSELYDQLIASGYAESTLDELTERAESIGDEGATTLSESLRSTITSIAAEAPEPSSGMGGGQGRRETEAGGDDDA